MTNPHKEEIIPVDNPAPLNIEVDPEKIKLWYEFTGGDPDKARELLYDSKINDPTLRQQSAAVFTAPGKMFSGCDISIHDLAVQSPQYKKDSRLTKEISIGLLYWHSKAAEYINSLEDVWKDYQTVYFWLLPRLFKIDKQLAMQIFELRDLRKYKTYRYDYYSSSYQPARDIISSKYMPHELKNLTLAKWFEIVRREESGVTKPRAEHERAVKWLTHYIDWTSSGKSTDEKKDVVVATVRFLETITKADTAYMGYWYDIAGIAALIDDIDLRYNFSRRNVMFNEEFVAHNDVGAKFLEWLLVEANRRDQPDCATRVQEMLRQYLEFKKFQETDKQKKISNHNRLLSKIRS